MQDNTTRQNGAQPTIDAGAAFTVSRTDSDGNLKQFRETEDRLTAALAQAARTARFSLEATVKGGVTITRIGTEANGYQAITFRYEPLVRADLTPRLHNHLAELATAAWIARTDGGGLTAPWHVVPAADAARLYANGLVADVPDELTPGGPGVRLTVTAGLKLAAATHRTRTTEPSGVEIGGIRDLTSWAKCACGWTEFGHDRTDAARRARDHRQQRTAAFAATLALNTLVGGDSGQSAPQVTEAQN